MQDTLALSVDAIATDNTVNIAEKTAGFAISGATGSEAGVSVSVTIGSQSPLTASSDNNGAWSVRLPANATYITGTSVAVSVSSARKMGYTSPRRRDAHPRGGPRRALGELHRAGVAQGGRDHHAP